MMKLEGEKRGGSFDEFAAGTARGSVSRGRALKSVGAAIAGAVLGMFASSRDAEARRLSTLWAVVNADGTLARGKGVASVSKSDTGRYEVKFKQDVTRCAYSATLNTSGFIFISLRGPSITPREVGVTTLDRGGFVRDSSFHLIVHC